jgi:hypothetical protein
VDIRLDAIERRLETIDRSLLALTDSIHLATAALDRRSESLAAMDAQLQSIVATCLFNDDIARNRQTAYLQRAVELHFEGLAAYIGGRLRTPAAIEARGSAAGDGHGRDEDGGDEDGGDNGRAVEAPSELVALVKEAAARHDLYRAEVSEVLQLIRPRTALPET